MNVINKKKNLLLFEYHQKNAAKQIQFSDWEVPAYFTSIIDEHKCVRSKVGLFDISHMGEIHVSGKGAYDYLQFLLTNDLDRYPFGKAFYSVMCFEDGGVVDDVFVYPKSKESYILIVNAANIDKDFEWMQKHSREDIVLENVSDEQGLVALQGPMSDEVLSCAFSIDSKTIKFHEFQQLAFERETIVISATGYTGERGFEIMYPKVFAQKIWSLLLESGKSFGVQPIGFGARDTLRLEAGCALYGHELSDSISPLEAGLGWIVRLQKEMDFIGKSALSTQKEKKSHRKLMGLLMKERAVPREGYQIFHQGERVGEITSGSFLPHFNRNGALALFDRHDLVSGEDIQIEIRGKMYEAEVASIPFYRIEK